MLLLRRAALLFALILSLQTSAGAQTAAPALAATPATGLFCPISARVEAFKGHDDEILISLWSVEGTARASGTLALYSGNLRYRVPFNNVIAASMINDAIPPTPIVIRFDTPTVIDSGYVGSLGNGECLIHSPFVRTKLETYVQTYGSDFPINSPIYPNWTAGLQKFRAAAAVTPAVLAAGARVDPPACDKPYVWASTTYAAPLEFPSSKMYTGLVAVRVTLDPSGHALAYHIDKNSYERPFNDAAVLAAAHSRFAPQIYRCSPVTGDYLFVADFMAEPFQKTIGHY
jgi:hypothetical protein